MSTQVVVEQKSEQSETEMLRKAARGFLVEEWPVEHAVQNCEKPDQMRKLFEKAAAQGWMSLGGDPEIEDSAEMLIALSDEVGRAAAALSLADSYIANMVLSLSSSVEPAQKVLQGLQQGTYAVSVALAAFDGDPNAGEVQISGREQKRVTGKLRFVEGLAIADYLLVFAGDGQAAVVPVTGEGVKTTLTPGLAVPALGDVEFSNAPATVFSVPHELLVEASAIARLASTARALGAANRTFELAVEYAKVRVQFDQPIGKFQAVQHKLANCSIWITATRCLIDETVQAYQRKKSDWEARADATRAYACTNLRQAEFDAQGVFGGLGFWEGHEAPRLFRRVHSEMLRYGGISAAGKSFSRYLLQDGYSFRPLPAHDLGEKAEAFRQKFRAWIAANYPAEKRRERWLTLPRHDQLIDMDFSKALARDGYLGLGWPKEVGGRGLSVAEGFVFEEESIGEDLPQYGHALAANIIGPSLLQFGTPEQIKKFLPRILGGELPLCIGYSEPESGSDMASLQTKAVKDGDDWLITGAKVHQTNGDGAEYTWLAARTDPNVPKHKGISIFLIPLNLPGITIQVDHGLNDHTACSIFYDSVRVPGDCLIGKVNEGFKIILTALAYERVGMGALIQKTVHFFTAFLKYLVTVKQNDKPLACDPQVREKVGIIAADVMSGIALSGHVLATLQSGKPPYSEAAMSKCVTGEIEKRCADGILDILGTIGTLNAHASGNAADGEFEYMVRDALWAMIGGGTPEIQRNTIAQLGLGLPK